MENLVRMLQGQIMAAIAAIIIVIVLSWLTKKYIVKPDDSNAQKMVNITRNVIIILVVIGLAGRVTYMAAYNNTPRSVIDRSIANDRADILDEDSHNLPPKVESENTKKTGEKTK